MLSETFTLDENHDFPYKVVANRYRPSEQQCNNGVTLLLSHGMGFHKELWEPTLARLFEKSLSNSVPIREAWAIDCPAHGDSAILNEKMLMKTYPKSLPISIHAGAIRLLISNSPVDFRGHNIVAIGHSMGAVAIIHSWSMLDTAPRLPYRSVILVEPWLSHPSDESNVQWQLAVGKAALARRDTWSSVEAAYLFMRERPFWKTWDDRVLKLYAHSGLRPEKGDNDQDSGVTLKCPKNLEAASMGSQEDRKTAYSHLRSLCTIPVHVVFGQQRSMFPLNQKMKIHNPSEGRVVQSIRLVEPAAHFVPQTHPDELGDAIYSILSERSDIALGSKL